MEEASESTHQFPNGLVDWAGHHSGGVKRLFDSNSGRPGKNLLRTNLLSKLEAWAGDVAASTSNTPRVLLLVGGPGNGKTEAIESTIKWLDEKLACDDKLVQGLSNAFHPASGQAVPRMVRVDAGSLASRRRPLELNIVQDASATAGYEGRSAPELLIDELNDLVDGDPSRLYLCCVNRGVLDDALIQALDASNANDLSNRILEAITRSVSLSSDAPPCWPLKGFPTVAVWPMDAESLLVKPDGDFPSPAFALFEYATASEHWPEHGTCAAGNQCPFCNSRQMLARQEPRAALLKILRWYELASGKRWSFRDLFSLASYILAGHRPAGHGQKATPCEWAAQLITLDQLPVSKKPSRQSLTALFHLATSSYQHALFHRWDKGVDQTLKQDIRDLGLDKQIDSAEVRTLLGLQYFLQERRMPYLPATIASLLEGLVDALDPAFADPESEVAVSSRTSVTLRELDIRFSRSLVGGTEYLLKSKALSKPEVDLLQRLGKADALLSSPAVRRRKPTAATRIQRTLRDFACRLARRSICTRTATVADAKILQPFQLVVEDTEKDQRLYEVAKQVKNLLNNHQDFEVSLTTTFGQPLAPPQRQATLIVQARQVKMLPTSTEGRPRSPICFLEVGSGKSAQPIALTYDLFKAVTELERGLSPASLPRTVVALLDTTRARLSGPIVRDHDVLRDAKIRIGSDGTIVARSWNGFVSSHDEEHA